MGDSHNGKGTGFHRQGHQEESILLGRNGMFGLEQGQSELSLPSYNNNFWDTAGPVQDDSFLQRGFYTGNHGVSQHFHGFLPTDAQSRPSNIGGMNLDFSASHQPDNEFGLQTLDMPYGFNDQARSQNGGQYSYLPSQHEQQQFPSDGFGQIPMKAQDLIDDTESVGYATTDCDSHCDLGDPCTEESCADREDACTDKHCPEKDCPDTNCPEKMPSEVVLAAETLATFGVGAPQSRCQDLAQQGFGAHSLSSSEQSLLNGMNDTNGLTQWDVMFHIGTAHVNPTSSHCAGPCPIYNPQLFQHFQHCPFPDTFDFQADSLNELYNPFSLTNFNNDASTNFLSQPQMVLHGCGAEIPNPEALVKHLRTQHQPFLENLLAQRHAYGGSPAPRLPGRTPSSSSSNALEASLSSATHSPQVSFPPTPLSLSHDMSNPPTKPPGGHHSRSSTVSQCATTGNEFEHQQCLWCHPQTGERCGQIFPDSEALFSHVNKQHIQKLEKGSHGFLCCWENCKRRGDGKEGFPQRSKIERHMHTHIGRKPYECEECGQKFSAQQALTQHMLIHSNKKPLRCDFPDCGKTFRQQSALTMHRRIHTGEKPLKCPVCGKAFSESSNLSKHKRIHETKGRFICSEPGCDKTFHRLDQLRRHQKSHPSSATFNETMKIPSSGEVKSEGVEDWMEFAGEQGEAKRRKRSVTEC